MIPVVSFWVSNSEMVTGVTEITSTSLLMGAVFILFVLTIFNSFLERFFPQIAFSGPELLVIYVMLALAMAINGIGMFGFLAPSLVAPFWFDTPENEWATFHPYIPDWFAPRDNMVVKNFFLGDSTFFSLEHIKAWAVPILTWSSFTFALLFMMLCLNVLVRKQWMEHERLSFPVTTIPLEMTLRSGTTLVFFKRKLFWIGFIIPVIMQSINTLHFFHPTIPYIWFIKAFDIGHFFTEKPFNAIGYLPVSFYPTVIGLTYLMPLDVSFSCWFFFLVRKMERVAVSMLEGTGTRFPAIGEQGAGAWIGLSLMVLWLGKKHFWTILSDIFRRKGDKEKTIPYGFALFSFIVGMLFMTLFCYQAGASFYLAIIYFGIFFVYMLAITRIRAEVGPIWHNPPVNPQTLTVEIFGSRALGAQNLTILAYLSWFDLDHRCAVMPHQLEGFRIAKEAKMKERRFFYIILLATALGIAFAFFNVLRMYYARGADTPRVNPWRVNMGKIPFFMLASWLNYPTSTDYTSLKFVGVGIVFVLFLTFMRGRFFWWPFHPVGYALANAWGSMYLFWSGMLAAWVVKFIIIRYGGIKFYRRALPFFIGILLGDFVIGSLWSIIGVLFNVPIYRVFPN